MEFIKNIFFIVHPDSRECSNPDGNFRTDALRPSGVTSCMGRCDCGNSGWFQRRDHIAAGPIFLM